MSLAFQGIISQDILSLVGTTLRKKPNSEIVSKRLFSIVVEMAQNIYHYSASRAYSEKDKKEIGVGVITIGENKDHYIVNSGNIATAHDAISVAERCEYINGLADEELKKFHKKTLREPQRADKPGANVGLIVMSRQSENKLFYDTTVINDQHTFITLSVRVSKKLFM
ncbi:MAG: hypothetical protein EAZ97_15345 [Bacteroidetes bacterium]|nr:MAG: hypothetical protein EAZ97_15345 [Bacteroidota bacterium]